MVKNLRLLREKHGLSQQSLAEKLGITQQAVYKYEKTSVEPDIATLIQLAELFDVSVDYLIGYEGAKSAKKNKSSKSEDAHLKLWRMLSEDNREKLDGLVKSILENNK